MPKRLAIVGLGPGSAAQLPPAALEVMRRSEIVLFRTDQHPAWEALPGLGIQACSFDHLYQRASDLEQVYAEIAVEVLRQAMERDVAYCVPGSPLFAEQSVKLLLTQAKAAGVAVTLINGPSSLDLALERLRLDPPRRVAHSGRARPADRVRWP